MRVPSELVGQNPWYVGGSSGFDQLRLGLLGRHHRHGDDQGVLALESFDEGGLVVVVDLFDGYAGGHRACAIGAGDGGDFVLVEFQERFDDVFADRAGGLWQSVNAIAKIKYCTVEGSGHDLLLLWQHSQCGSGSPWAACGHILVPFRIDF